MIFLFRKREVIKSAVGLKLIFFTLELRSRFFLAFKNSDKLRSLVESVLSLLRAIILFPNLRKTLTTNKIDIFEKERANSEGEGEIEGDVLR